MKNVIFLAVVMAFALVACNQKADETTNDQIQKMNNDSIMIHDDSMMMHDGVNMIHNDRK